MNEVQIYVFNQNVSQKTNDEKRKDEYFENKKDTVHLNEQQIKEHFMPIIDNSLPVQRDFNLPSNIFLKNMSGQHIDETLKGGIFGQTPPFVKVMPQYLDFQTQSFPYGQNSPLMPVSLIQPMYGTLPPNYRYARGNGVPRQVEKLF